MAQLYKRTPGIIGMGFQAGPPFAPFLTHSVRGVNPLDWGYGDVTIKQFEADAGLRVPVDSKDPKRFGKRHEWLKAHAWQKWIDWRNRKKTLTIRDAAGKVRETYTESTSDLLYTPEKIVSELSRVLTLHPGDIISSGTGKSFVARPGDEVTLSIEGLGSFSFRVVK